MYQDILNNRNGFGYQRDIKYFICDTENDIPELPTNKSIYVGSRALVVESKNIYILNNAKEWKLLYNVATSGGSGAIGSISGVECATLDEITNYVK